VLHTQNTSTEKYSHFAIHEGAFVHKNFVISSKNNFGNSNSKVTKNFKDNITPDSGL
jgi:hypothetical protein